MSGILTVRCVGCADTEYPCSMCWAEAERSARLERQEREWKRHHERWMNEGATLVEVG